MNEIDRVRALIVEARSASTIEARSRAMRAARAQLDDARVAIERSVAAVVIDVGAAGDPLIAAGRGAIEQLEKEVRAIERGEAA